MLKTKKEARLCSLIAWIFEDIWKLLKLLIDREAAEVTLTAPRVVERCGWSNGDESAPVHLFTAHS
jgi:hypothetical protein